MNETSVMFWCLAIVGVLLTGISKSGFAGGAGVVAVPLMALVIPVSEAVVIMLPLLLVMDARTIRYYFRHANLEILRKIIPASLLGIAVGGILLGVFPDNTLTLALAIVSIMFALWQQFARLLANIKGSAWIWGSISGLTSTLIHAGGPPINMYFLGLKAQKLSWLATTAVFFGAMNLVKIIPYTLNNQWNIEALSYAAILFPVAILGVGLGKVLQERLSEVLFMNVCRALLFASGLMLLLKVFFL